MSAAKDKPVSKPPTDKYREGWDKIFGKKKEVKKKDKACPPESLCRCDHCE